MKKSTLLLIFSLCLLIGSFFIYSCRKDARGGKTMDDNSAQTLEAAKILYAQGATLNSVTYGKLFEENNKVLLSNGAKPKKTIFKKLSPLWKDAFQIKAFDGSDLIVVPTLENKFSEKKFEIRRFFIFTAKGNAVTEGKIIEFLDLQSSLQENVESFIANYRNSAIPNLTGAIFQYDLNYFLEKAEVIRQGKRTGVTPSLYNLPAAKNSGPSKTTMGYYDSDPYNSTGCYKIWYCDGDSFGVTCIFQGYDGTCEINPPTGSDSGYDSSGSQQGGGGGSYGGNTSPTISIEFNGPKINPTAELKCFKNTEPATLTIYVQQPNPNTRDMRGPNQVGHAFNGITQDGVTRTLGFYPDRPTATLIGSQNSEIHDNSGDLYHVSLARPINPTELSNVLTYIKAAPATYSLSGYNCTDFAIAVAAKGGITLPSTTGSYQVIPGITYTGRNPGDLGQDIRAMTLPAGSGLVRTAGQVNAPAKAGTCP